MRDVSQKQKFKESFYSDIRLFNTMLNSQLMDRWRYWNQMRI